MHSEIPAPSCNTFLIIQLARFGDLIQTKRLVLSLQTQGAVHLLVDRSLTALAALIYPRVQVHGIAAHGSHGPDLLGKIHADLRHLAALSFTTVYNLNFSGLNFALSAMFEAQCVRGYKMDQGQRLIDFWPEQVMRWTRKRTVAGLNLVDIWGLYAQGPLAPAEVNPPATAQGHGLGVVMAGQHARRSLPPQILAPLVHAAWQRIGGGPVTLLGAGPERRAARELAAMLPAGLRGNVRDLVGQTGWPELMDVVSGLDLLLTPDTGTMHLAAHMGVPVLAFFLSSAWCHETGPYGRGHLVLQAAPACAPCLEAAPCGHEVHCRSFFNAPAVLRHVSGRTDKDIGAGGMVLASNLDALGLTWNVLAGTDPQAGERRAFRALAQAIAQVGCDADCDRPDMHLIDIESWMLERDWVLPKIARGRIHE